MSIEQTVAQLYAQELGRAPDAAGAAYWSNALASGASVDAVRQAFQTSPEAQARGCLLYTSDAADD